MTKIIVAGDYCPNDRISKLIEKEHFSNIFDKVNPLIATADYSIVNFECAVDEQSSRPIAKCGPNLKTTRKAIQALKYAGFKMVTLANNHFYDYGVDGVFQTLNGCKQIGIDYVGGGMNLNEASETFYKTISDSKFAIINCCEQEYSIATEKTGGSNPLNPIRQYYDIIQAKSKADYIIVIVHGGHEMFQYPSIRMQEIYRFFVDAGADVVINHHQHCFSGYEIYNNKPIFYGLGNFCFDEISMRNEIWNEGFLLELNFNVNQISFNLHPYIQCNLQPIVIPLSDCSEFKQKINKINKIIVNKRQLNNENSKFYESRSKSLLNAFQPYEGRVLRKLFSLGLLPNFLSKNKIFLLENLIKCESHRDVVQHFFSNLRRKLNYKHSAKC